MHCAALHRLQKITGATGCQGLSTLGYDTPSEVKLFFVFFFRFFHSFFSYVNSGVLAIFYFLFYFFILVYESFETFRKILYEVYLEFFLLRRVGPLWRCHDVETSPPPLEYLEGGAELDPSPPPSLTKIRIFCSDSVFSACLHGWRGKTPLSFFT